MKKKHLLMKPLPLITPKLFPMITPKLLPMIKL